MELLTKFASPLKARQTVWRVVEPLQLLIQLTTVLYPVGVSPLPTSRTISSRVMIYRKFAAVIPNSLVKHEPCPSV